MPIKFQQKHFHRLYLAGPITDVPDYKERFAEAERDFSEHYDVINPARILEGVDDRDCLPLCLRLIDRADSVVLLPGWRSSMGAVTEALYAVRQGKDVTAFERKDAAYSVRWDGEKLTIGSDEKTRRWIPVSERLPEINQQVLLSTNDGAVCMGHRLTPETLWQINDRDRKLWVYDPEIYTENIDDLPKSEDCAFIIISTNLDQILMAVTSPNYRSFLPGVSAWMELPEPYEEANK